ncbi:hypothetical protein [Leifsonia sp. NPDC077715]|uniref:hypothetical protein n=1 Tax=Leifsonia sp. NPDC077715 TaxID=3155539 RepID=UPI0034192D09
MSILTSDPSLGTTSTIGKYFGVVSTVPSLIGTTWLYLLFLLHPWQSPLDWSSLAANNPIAQPIQGLVLIAVAISIAVVTHPLQFVIVQLMEGYWGTSTAGLALAYRRALVQARRFDRALRLFSKVNPQTRPREEPLPPGSTRAERDARARQALMQALTFSASSAEVASFPSTEASVLPTRLGNVLRRYEARAGQSIGLPILNWATFIGMVADARHTAYVQDQRQGLDLAVRMTAVSLLCAAVSTVALWPHGLWVLLAVLPYAAAWLSYRGALAAAHAYGKAFEAWLYLNRFTLYEQLHLATPKTSNDEQELGAQLEEMLGGAGRSDVEYDHRSEKRSED